MSRTACEACSSCSDGGTRRASPSPIAKGTRATAAAAASRNPATIRMVLVRERGTRTIRRGETTYATNTIRGTNATSSKTSSIQWPSAGTNGSTIQPRARMISPQKKKSQALMSMGLSRWRIAATRIAARTTAASAEANTGDEASPPATPGRRSASDEGGRGDQGVEGEHDHHRFRFSSGPIARAKRSVIVRARR